MSTIDTRREQMFPKLEPREIDRLRRFGEVRRYAAGEALFVTGDIAPGMSVLINGSVRVTRRDPLGHSAPIVEQGPGEFVAKWDNCPASQRSSTPTRSMMWKPFSLRPKICAP